MSIPSFLLAIGVIAAVVVGSLFAVNYYASKNTITDSYSNTVTDANNQTIGVVSNVSSTGTNVESGFFIFIAVAFVFAGIGYFATKRH